MMKSKLFSLTLVVASTLTFAIAIWANVPPPPANQQIGVTDSVYSNLQEGDCRLCHENPDQFPVEDETIANRHNLLYGQPIPEGSVVPNPDADNDGIPDTVYGCLNCHEQTVDPDSGAIIFLVERDCLQCHVQGLNQPTVHHLTAAAQAADCVSCHGDFVDNMGDGHTIRTYTPSLITPKPSGGNGEPTNSRGKGAGACDYCHDDDGLTPPVIQNNMSNHHETGFYAQGKCNWCHGFVEGGCVGCHSSAQGALGERRQVAGGGGDFEKTSHHIGPDVSDGDCMVCHDMTYHLDGNPATIPDPQVYLRDPDGGPSIVYDGTDTSLEAFCLNCHDDNGANGNSTPFSDGVSVPNVKGVAGSMWVDSAHATRGYSENGGAPITCFGNGSTTGCHANGHGSDSEKLLSVGTTIDQLCYNCHTNGKVINDAISNNRPGGYVSADDIQEAFGKSEVHNLGTGFSLGGGSFTLQCTTCHNPHVVTGRYWDAEIGLSPITRPDFSDPTNNPRAMGKILWGAVAGEKMDDFVALGSGSGGWYYSIARGGIVWDQPAVYQPPKQGSGWNYEFAGDILPDYTSLCLDCHSYRMSDSSPPVNWGQGIGCTDNSVDPPDQRIECGAQHGLAPANKPNYWGDVGMYGSSGDPDPIFNEPGVTRGRGAGHFMRWPYDSAFRNAGINFVMSCTDCHEAHGSNRGSIIRERFNVTANGDCGTGGDTSPNGENCTDAGNWNSYCNACHYYYGGQHAGMSCGNASCHEANSPHRIIHVTHSGSTNLWTEPSRPDYTPEIESIVGEVGSNDLTVTFTEGVWTNMDQTGALKPEDFLLTDVNGDNPTRTIESVTHTPGESTAIITMSEPLTVADSENDMLATLGISVWDADGDPAGPWPMTIAGCPGAVNFQLNEPAGSTITDDSGLLIGTVNNPTVALPGDGYFHGDEAQDTYIDIDNTDLCLMSPRTLTIEARVKPTTVDMDYGNGGTPDVCTSDYDCDIGGTVSCSCGRDTSTDRNNRCPGGTGGCDADSGYYYGCTMGYQSGGCPSGEVCCPNPGEGCWNNTGFCTTASENATFSRIFERKRNIKVTILHTDYRGDNMPERAGKASVEVKYFVDTDSRHTCPHEQWPEDDYVGNDARWHQISSDIDQWPIVDNHWYKIKVVFDSDKPGTGPPVDIFLDDQGTNGLNEPNPGGLDPDKEQWEGYVNASNSINDSSSCKWGALPGDFIATENQYAYIGSSPNHSQLFKGLIDWVAWQPVADYSGVVSYNSWSSYTTNNSQLGFGGIRRVNYRNNTGIYNSSSNPAPTYDSEPETMSNEGTAIVVDDPEIVPIRICEGCHGFESLHNIAVDSDDADTELTVGGENPGYSHVGNNDDCWGCHGFYIASNAPGTGPITPYVSRSDVSVMTAGHNTVVTLTGIAFTNLIYDFEWSSNVLLTAADGSSVTLTPDAITQGTLTVTIPATTAPGNYNLQAVKGDVASNPVVISIKPEVVITGVRYFKCQGIVSITGSGFGEKPDGTDYYINAKEGDITLDIITWTETKIIASGIATFSGTVTVNALLGSATWQQ